MTSSRSVKGLRLLLIGVIFQPVSTQEGYGCEIVSSSADSTIEVAVTDQVNRGLCKNQNPKITDDVMGKQCSEFCAISGQFVSVPLLVGSSSYGFNLKDIDSICANTDEQSFILHSDTLKAQCQSDSAALQNMQEAIADFVAAVKIIKLEQIAFQAEMEDKTQALHEDLASDAFKRKMEESSTKLTDLKAKISEWKEDLVRSSRENFKIAMDDVSSKGFSMKESIQTNLQRFQNFLEQCNRMMLGTSADAHYVFDICAQGNKECIDDTKARHVGCCCGINPVALGKTYNIDGLSAPSLDGLQLQADRMLSASSDEEVFNVCAESSQRSEVKRSALNQRIERYSSGRAFLDQETSKLKSQYSSYADASCVPPSRRLAVGEENTRVVHDIVVPRNATPRFLQSTSQCVPQTIKEVGLKVAFSDFLEAGVCKRQSPPVTDEKMQKTCNNFCKPYGVPILMGNTAFGFDLSQMEDLIFSSDEKPSMQKGGVLDYNPGLLEDCMSWRNAFVEVDLKTANLLQRLEEFTAAKNVFVARQLQAVKKLKTFVSSTNFVKQMDESSDKMGDFKKALAEQVEELSSDVAMGPLKEAMNNILDAVKVLDATLTANLEKMRSFLEKCSSEMFVGVGASKEYLLDICAQESTGCIEKETGDIGHVGCACAFNPAITLGVTHVDSPIDGISQMSDPARVNRRLEESGDPDIVDMCALGWERAKPNIEKMNEEILELGEQHVIEEHERRMKSKYGELYCGFGFSGGQTGVNRCESQMTMTMTMWLAVVAILAVGRG